MELSSAVTFALAYHLVETSVTYTVINSVLNSNRKNNSIRKKKQDAKYKAKITSDGIAIIS